MLVFLKLGGSLISDKNSPRTARPDVLARLAAEIAAARQADPALKLLLGHGSGSFGPQSAKKHNTRQGVHSTPEWQGFAEVWRDARTLNQIVVEALASAGLPVLAFPPSAAVLATDGQVASWDLQPLQRALATSLLPLVAGDVIFDTQRGGTILSTEELFYHLALHLRPKRILLAGIEAGVWADYPTCTRLLNPITLSDFHQHAHHLGGSAAVDVTGGMAKKVESMLALIEKDPGLEALIFSGDQPDLVRQALLGASPGTLIRS